MSIADPSLRVRPAIDVKTCPSRPPAIIAGLSARDLDRLSLPPRGKLVEVRPMGNGWAIRARCSCGCGATMRAVYALTVPAAVWRFRFARREAQLVEEAFNG